MKLNKLIEGLLILQGLYGDQPISFHSGSLYAGEHDPAALTPGQNQRLAELGWYENEESWAIDI